MRTPAQDRALRERSAAGGRAKAAAERARRYGRAQALFVSSAVNFWYARPAADPMLDNYEALAEVLLAYVIAVYEQRMVRAEESLGRGLKPLTRRHRQRYERLVERVDADALRGARRMGSDWRSLFEVIEREEERIEAEPAEGSGQEGRKKT